MAHFLVEEELGGAQPTVAMQLQEIDISKPQRPQRPQQSQQIWTEHKSSTATPEKTAAILHRLSNMQEPGPHEAPKNEVEPANKTPSSRSVEETFDQLIDEV